MERQRFFRSTRVCRRISLAPNRATMVKVAVACLHSTGAMANRQSVVTKTGTDNNDVQETTSLFPNGPAERNEGLVAKLHLGRGKKLSTSAKYLIENVLLENRAPLLAVHDGRRKSSGLL